MVDLSGVNKIALRFRRMSPELLAKSERHQHVRIQRISSAAACTSLRSAAGDMSPLIVSEQRFPRQKHRIPRFQTNRAHQDPPGHSVARAQIGQSDIGRTAR